MVNCAGILFIAHDNTAARSAQGFVRGRGGIGGNPHWRVVKTGTAETGDVGNICH